DELGAQVVALLDHQRELLRERAAAEDERASLELLRARDAVVDHPPAREDERRHRERAEEDAATDLELRDDVPEEEEDDAAQREGLQHALVVRARGAHEREVVEAR